MANLNHLSIPSLSSLSHEAGLDLILSIRERRRFVPEKLPRTKTVKERSSIPPEAVVANMSEQQITDLYYKLMAKQQKELL